MTDDPKACIDYWRAVTEKIQRCAQLDDGEVVFGARTRGIGHNYRFLPVVSDVEVEEFEQRSGLSLPLEYRTFIQTCGAGGAGPYSGIYDFRRQVLPQRFEHPFPYTDTLEDLDECADDDPIWSRPGLAFIGEIGCGSDLFLEINGPQPGQIWCGWSEAFSRLGSFLEFYDQWLIKVETGLERRQRLKDFKALPPRRTWMGLGKAAKHTLRDAVAHMQCEYTRREYDGKSSVPQGETWIHFAQTPGKLVINEREEVLRIEISNRAAIR